MSSSHQNRDFEGCTLGCGITHLRCYRVSSFAPRKNALSRSERPQYRYASKDRDGLGRPFGFTLLEVLLALALSSVLLGVLAMAIRVQVRATDSGRTDVAQAQLARALLKRIGDDVRAAVWYEQIDPNAMVVPPKSSSMSGASNSGSGGPSMAGGGSSPSNGSGGSPSTGGGGGSGSNSGSGSGSGGATQAGSTTTTAGTQGAGTATTASTATAASTASAASSASSASTTGGAGGTGGSGGGGGGGGRGGGGAGASITTTQNLAQAAMMYPQPMMPGLVGGNNWLQVDISALPRLDQVMQTQMNSQPSTTGATRAADMKTVSYFMAAAPGMPQAMSTQLADGSRGQGLLRKEAGRSMGLQSGAMTGAASAGGATMSTSATTSAAGKAALPEPLAPEVVKLEFQYFDGAGWQSSWNSQQRNMLPKAVKILASFRAGAKESSADEIAATDREKLVTYQLVVSPAAWRPVPAWVTAMQSASGLSGGTGTPGSTGMPGGGAF